MSVVTRTPSPHLAPVAQETAPGTAAGVRVTRVSDLDDRADEVWNLLADFCGVMQSRGAEQDPYVLAHTAYLRSSITLVAESGARPVGLAVIVPGVDGAGAEAGWVEAFYVRERGVARTLLAAAETAAREAGYPRLVFEMPRVGRREVSRRLGHFGYEKKAIIYAKELGP